MTHDQTSSKHQLHYMTVDCNDKLNMPISNSFVACEWLSLKKQNNKATISKTPSQMPIMLNLGQTCNNTSHKSKPKIKPSKKDSNTETPHKKKRIFFKRTSNSNSQTSSLIQKNLLKPLIEPCTCSTMSTTVNTATTTTTTTTSSSAASFSSSSASSTTNRPSIQTDIESLNPTTSDNHHTNNYQKLFFKPNEKMNEISGLNEDQTKLYNNLNKMSGKVALLCNGDSNSPQILQILDLNQDSLLIPKFYECIQFLNVNLNSNQTHENHYENNREFNNPVSIEKKSDSTEQVYELIDDSDYEQTNRQINEVGTKMSTFNPNRQMNTQQSGANQTLGHNMKKYPKTNPNYAYNSALPRV